MIKQLFNFLILVSPGGLIVHTVVETHTFILCGYERA